MLGRVTFGPPLSPEERTRRVTALTIAETARRSNGGIHQDEPIAEYPEERSGTAREAPGTQGERVGGEPIPVGVQPAAPHPPVDRWVPDGTGIMRWRPIYDRLDIAELTAGERLMVLSSGFKLKLDAECSAALAWRLMPEEWRVLLGDSGVR